MPTRIEIKLRLYKKVEGQFDELDLSSHISQLTNIIEQTDFKIYNMKIDRSDSVVFNIVDRPVNEDFKGTRDNPIVISDEEWDQWNLNYKPYELAKYNHLHISYKKLRGKELGERCVKDRWGQCKTARY